MMAFARTNAQDFSLHADTVRKDNVAGTPGLSCDESYLLDNYMRNRTNAALTIKWILIEKSLPAGWKLCGICDNALCRDTSSPALTAFAEQETYPVAIGDSSLMKAMIMVPASSPAGIGVVRVKAYTSTTTDTATFIITKGTTSISAVGINDKRVLLHPNPAIDDLTIFTDKSLNAACIEIMDITGARRLVQRMVKDTEVSRVDIRSLAAALYLVKITDARGVVITTRKFSKR